jgi:PAS domain S-box-containing protein
MSEKRDLKTIPIEELKYINAPKHMSLIYDTPQEWQAFVHSFISLGLEQNEKCLYVYDTHSAKQLRDTLKSVDIDIAAAESSGQLVMVHGSRFHIKEGFFDPDKMLGLLIQETRNALHKGFKALRVTTETEWVLQQFPGSDKILECESKANQGLCLLYPCFYVGQYERAKFTIEMIKGIMQTHPIIIRSNKVFPNSYYVAPETFLKEKHVEIQTLDWFKYAEREVRMEKELQERSHRFELLFENAMAIILVMDETGRYIDANNSALEFMECTREELFKMAIRDTMTPGYARNPLQPLSKPQLIEAEYVIKGKIKTVLLNLVPITAGGKKVVYGIGQDITPHKQMEEALAQSEQNFRAMAENSNDTIFVLAGEKGNVVYCNKQATELTSYSGDELLRLTINDLVAEHEQARLMENYRRRLQGENLANRYEVDIVTQRGEVKVVEVSGAKTLWQGKVADMAILRDVTGRKHIEQALKISEEKLRTIFETISDGITLSDLSGRIVDVNKKILQLNAISRKEDALGKNIFNFVSPRSQQKAREGFEKCLKEGTLDNVEINLSRTDGSEYVGELSGSVLRNNLGEPVGVIIVSRDISDRKTAQEAIEGLYQKEKTQRQELEEEAKSRGMFIDVLAHELRTPLTPIIVSSEMLQEMCSTPSDSVQSKLVQHLNQGVHVLSSRLEDLLDIGRYSRGTFKLNIIQTDLKKFFSEVLSRCGPVFGERGQLLVSELADDLTTAEIDPLRLEQVIVNLLSNASKFSRDRGTIVTKARNQGNGLMVEVIDFGIGVTAEEKERLFQPYHRIEQDRQKFPGIGLGLAVSRQIVEAHGGRIWLTSQSGKGSIFSFFIPLKHGQEIPEVSQ